MTTKNWARQIFLWLILFHYVNGNAQFGFTPGVFPLFSMGRTVATIDGIGIGTFPSATPTNARFHVSNFFCAQPNGALNGFLFRTDGNSNFDNQWQIYLGA